VRFAIATLGCKVNQYDSAVIESRLLSSGMRRVEFDEPAEVYIVNTCAVTDRADAESLRLARRARRLNPSAKVIVTGCLAQARPQMLAASDAVDRVIGLGMPEELIRAALGQDSAAERVTVVNLRKQKGIALDSPGVTMVGQTRAFLKVQEGCDRFCSFCIVPFSRGRSRSTPPRRVLEALDELHQQSVKEVVLCGTQLGSYGRDLDPPASLAQLLEMIAERSAIPRVRISSLEPDELSDEIIELMAADDRFCPHFHLPLQSGSDTILRRMRRPYLSAFYRELVLKIVQKMPQACIGTDIIVGFPGESTDDFEQTVQFLSDLPLGYFHVFPYSIRSGTTAAKLSAKVEQGEIKRRAKIIRALGEQKRRRFVSRFVGARLRVLLEETYDSQSGRLKGYTRNYIRVLVKAPDYLRNQEVEVRAAGLLGDGLAGTLV